MTREKINIKKNVLKLSSDARKKSNKAEQIDARLDAIEKILGI